MDKPQFEPESTGPLQGVRVLDLSRLVAGNMLTLQLADFGADVIKVEDPGTGDPLRDWRTRDLSLHWKVYGRNKKSLAVRLRDPRGLKILADLIATADVLVENFRPGTLEKMGLAPETLLAGNPGLVIARISGFGQSGPYKYRPGFGTIVEGMSGFAAKNGFADRPPVLPPMAMADMISGLYGAYAVMVALRHRDAGNGGQVIDVPLLDSVLSILGPDAAIFTLTGELPLRSGSRSPIAGPRNVFETGDKRWISISAPMQAMTERLFRAIGRPEMIDDPRFATNAARMHNIVPRLSASPGHMSRPAPELGEHTAEVLAAAGVPPRRNRRVGAARRAGAAAQIERRAQPAAGEPRLSQASESQPGTLYLSVPISEPLLLNGVQAHCPGHQRQNSASPRSR